MSPTSYRAAPPRVRIVTPDRAAVCGVCLPSMVYTIAG
ncbi:hypothetical protein EHZ47_16315 [Aeromonas jandaei]|nr:hypothetical protein EHZ47_16315 [Aeromonas jandaei]